MTEWLCKSISAQSLSCNPYNRGSDAWTLGWLWVCCPLQSVTMGQTVTYNLLTYLLLHTIYFHLPVVHNIIY